MAVSIGRDLCQKTTAPRICAGGHENATPAIVVSVHDCSGERKDHQVTLGKQAAKGGRATLTHI